MAKTTLSQRQRILNMLNSGKTLSASTIASRLRIPRENVMKRVHDLRNSGYDIESYPSRTKGANGHATVAYALS